MTRTAKTIIADLCKELDDSETEREFIERALAALEDGAALEAMGITDDDQEAVEEAHFILENQMKMYEALYEVFDGYSDAELVNGAAAEALIENSGRHFYARTDPTNHRIKEGATDEEISKVLVSLIEDAIHRIIEVETDDVFEASMIFRKTFYWM